MDFQLKQLSAIDNGMAEYTMLQDIGPNENGFTNEVNGMTYGEFKEWLVQQEDYARSQNLPAHFVAQTTYFLYAGNQPVGIARIRHSSSEALEKQGVGTFGYGIAKAYRGKGYGNLLFVQILKKCQLLGYTKVRSYVETGNAPSNRIFVKNGSKCVGVFQGVKYIYETAVQ